MARLQLIDSAVDTSASTTMRRRILQQGHSVQQLPLVNAFNPGKFGNSGL